MANQCTKLEVSSFSHSGDILGGSKKLNRGLIFYLLVRLDIAYLCTKFDSSSLSHSLDMDGGSKIYKKLCYDRGTVRHACQYRKKLAIDE